MKLRIILFFLFIQSLWLVAQNNNALKVGAECTDDYLLLLENKNVGIVANQTSQIGTRHLVDSLLQLHVRITKIFSPEHGFRGNADAGETVSSYTDSTTNIPVLSLYGKNYKPKAKDLENIDIVVFDIQDVGVRFYTYISTLHYIMEACAEQNIPVIILDRPNPNGHYVDGPILDTAYRSFVGMHPVPLVHGMTIGEYARMINGEKWLKNGIQCTLTVVECENYTHNTHYSLPVKPSPNLPNDLAISLYPTLGLFEGTVISCGRGTDLPFQVIGNPELKNQPYTFTPRSIDGASKNPPYKGIACHGLNFTQQKRSIPIVSDRLNICILAYMFDNYKSQNKFFNSFFNKLAGNSQLRQQIENKASEAEIRESWKEGLTKFQKVRNKYLLYR